MNKPKIYLAGTMTGLSFQEQNEWRIALSEKLQEYFVCINPCKYYNFETPQHDTDAEVMKFDINALKRCDLVVVNLEHRSTGTSMELAIANEYKIPVIGLNRTHRKEIHPWVKCCVDKTLYSIEDLVDFLICFYSEV